MFLSLPRGPLPPFGWRSWCPRSVHRLLAASPCHGLSPSPSTLSQSDCPGGIRSSSLRQLVRPSKPRVHPWALPCAPTIRGPHAVGTHPGSIAAASPERLPRCCLPRRGSGSAPSHPINCGALSPMHWGSGLRAPCLRFAVCVTAPDARLGTGLLAPICQGRHCRRLDCMRLQGATPPDPDVRHARIRFLGSQSLGTTLAHHCAALHSQSDVVDDPGYG